MTDKEQNHDQSFSFFEDASDDDLKIASGGLRGDGGTTSKRHKRRQPPPPPTPTPGIHLPSDYWRKYGPEYKNVSPLHVWDSEPDANGIQQGGLGIA